MITKDYYKLLGIKPTASLQEIKRAYRKLVFQYHPDVNNGSLKKEESFKLLSSAYSILSDRKKRLQYDRTLLSRKRINFFSRKKSRITRLINKKS